MGEDLVHEGRCSAGVPGTFQQSESAHLVEKGRYRQNRDRSPYDQDGRKKTQTFGANSGVQNEK